MNEKEHTETEEKYGDEIEDFYRLRNNSLKICPALNGTIVVRVTGIEEIPEVVSVFATKEEVLKYVADFLEYVDDAAGDTEPEPT